MKGWPQHVQTLVLIKDLHTKIHIETADYQEGKSALLLIVVPSGAPVRQLLQLVRLDAVSVAREVAAEQFPRAIRRKGPGFRPGARSDSRPLTHRQHNPGG